MNEDGSNIQPEDMKVHLTKVANTLMDAGGRLEQIEQATLERVPVDFEVTGADVEATLARMSQHSAVGPDKIPANILKELNDLACESISEVFNQILSGKHEVPRERRKGRVSLRKNRTLGQGISPHTDPSPYLTYCIEYSPKYWGETYKNGQKTPGSYRRCKMGLEKIDKVKTISSSERRRLKQRGADRRGLSVCFLMPPKRTTESTGVSCGKR